MDNESIKRHSHPVLDVLYYLATRYIILKTSTGIYGCRLLHHVLIHQLKDYTSFQVKTARLHMCKYNGKTDNISVIRFQP
jgi:hypothetical protein